MLRMKAKGGGDGSSPPVSGRPEATGGCCEVRPGGMLVQKRNSDSNLNLNLNPVPNIRVKVKYGSSYHEVTISSQASFGELKKIVAGQTGVDTQDQKMMYREKERRSKDFLDVCGVKDGSKIVMVEDEVSKERRRIESRRNAKMEKASKDIAGIRSAVDNLAKKVASAEAEINKGKKMVETDLLNLIEQLMTELLKLDGIDAEGDVKLERRMQVKRVQKLIETLDVVKMRNSGLGKAPLQQIYYAGSATQTQMKQGSLNIGGEVVVTTKWETF